MVTFSLVEFEPITNPTDIECYFQNGCCNYLIKKAICIVSKQRLGSPISKTNLH
jgi:hypothetical protein